MFHWVATLVMAVCSSSFGQSPSRAILLRPIPSNGEQSDTDTQSQPLRKISFAHLLEDESQETVSGSSDPHNSEILHNSGAGQLPVGATDLQSLEEIPIQWWRDRIQKPILEKQHWLTFDAALIMLDALTHSPRVNAVAAEPLVTEADIIEADAAFDPAILLDSKIGRTSDPVGNELVTGGSERLREETLVYRMGVSRLGRRGGQFEAVQELGLLDNNSRFLVPPNQGNSRLSMSLNQPLLAGAGRVFNERLIVQAKIDNRIAWQESLEEVQTRLADIYAAYWQLYALRAEAIQQYDLLVRGQWVEERIVQREILDASKSQIVRAQAAVARREAAMIQAVAAIGDQQSRLKALVGSPNLQSGSDSEFIPREMPEFVAIDGTRREAVMTGLQYHPQIRVAAHQLESAGLALQVTKNQLLPLLNAVVDTYVAGLNGNSGAFDSFVDQFSEGEPGFSAGLEYEFPIQNRAARARHKRQQYVLAQQQNELREVMLEVTAEIEIAYRAMEVARAEIEARRRTLEAARVEETFFARRWEMIPGEDGSASFILEDLLDAQERRTNAERQWVTAKVSYLVSIARLQQAMGTLLMSEGVQPVRHDHCDRSQITFVRSNENE